MDAKMYGSLMNAIAQATPLRFAKAITLALVLILPSEAQSAPANTLRELYAAVGVCLNVTTGTPGSEMTIVFSLKSDGSLLGMPKISHTKLLGDQEAQREFVRDILAALGKCLPLSVTEGLGQAVAGRPITFRIVSQPRKIETQGTCQGEMHEAHAPDPIACFERDASLDAS
jgi:hypothetical protein